MIDHHIIITKNIMMKYDYISSASKQVIFIDLTNACQMLEHLHAHHSCKQNNEKKIYDIIINSIIIIIYHNNSDI